MTYRHIAKLIYFFATTVISTQAQAHHGVDFLTVQTAHLPEKGTGYVAARQDYISAHEDELEFEPTLLFGAADWAAVEIHAHVEKETGHSAKLESVAPALLVRFTPRDQALAIGMSAEYEFARESGEEDVVETALIIGHESASLITSANFKYEKASGTSGEWGYAAGIRHAFSAKHSGGVELRGSFEHGGSAEILLGYYGELTPRFTINAGFGTGVDDGPDWSVHTALIWRFK